MSLQYIGAVTLVIGLVSVCGIVFGKRKLEYVFRLALINWCISRAGY